MRNNRVQVFFLISMASVTHKNISNANKVPFQSAQSALEPTYFALALVLVVFKTHL